MRNWSLTTAEMDKGTCQCLLYTYILLMAHGLADLSQGNIHTANVSAPNFTHTFQTFAKAKC